MWIDSWDPDCEADFRAWMATKPPLHLRQACARFLSNFRESYLFHGPPEDAQRHDVFKINGNQIWLFGFTAAYGSICMYVGVCEESNEMRMLIFGPGDKHESLSLAKQRCKNWKLIN